MNLSEKIEEILKTHAPSSFVNDDEAYAYLHSLLIDDYESIHKEGKEYLHSLLDGFLSNDGDNNNIDIINKLLWDEFETFSNIDSTTNVNTDLRMQKKTIQILQDHDDPTSSPTTTITTTQSPREKPKKRKERKTKKSEMTAEDIRMQSRNELEELDDYSSAWKECKEKGLSWGGRGYGGRGVSSYSTTKTNIHLSNVTMQYDNKELLQNSTIQITQGNRYGLIGRNGVGKSTLLSRIYNKDIPGFPLDVRIVLVSQQVEGDDRTALQTLLDSDVNRKVLIERKEYIENKIDEIVASSDDIGDELSNLSNELSQILSELGDDDDGETDVNEEIEKKAIKILKGLQFTTKMIHQPSNELSGGWKMRLAIAKALFIPSDLLLLDEPTNHLDLHAVLWLSNYLSKEFNNGTLIVVSHDKSFLDVVCTHIINFEKCKLNYYNGNYTAYSKTQEEKAARQAQIIDAADRQRTKALQFIEKQQRNSKKKSHDPNKLKQAKMMKEKKLDRIGNYREDGKRYKNFSLKVLDENALRTAQKVVVDVDDGPVLRFKFPEPLMLHGSLLQMQDVAFRYNGDDDKNGFLLQDVTLDIEMNSKIAIVGRNGVGKSTLLKLITGDIEKSSTPYTLQGSITPHAKLRIGHITQHSVEALDEYASYTLVQYMEHCLKSNVQLSSLANNMTSIRSHLGAFGLGSTHYAHRSIASLSGGEKMRLCFATIFTYKPHLLLLDEPTNHLDMETLDALALALRDYKGAVLIVSHNVHFLCGFCKDLWIVEDGRLSMKQHSEGEEDDSFFRNNFLDYQKDAILERSYDRSAKINLARRAAVQRSGVKQTGGFIG